MTDSMRMFQLGLEGGKTRAAGQIGVQPEWFYKGDGSCIVATGAAAGVAALRPRRRRGGGDRRPVRDRRRRRRRCAWASPWATSSPTTSWSARTTSTWRTPSCAPARSGRSCWSATLPPSIAARVRVLRDGNELWAAEFLTGEANMSHTLANLEHHHFKYAIFRRPGDVHCHFFGAAVLSFSAGVKAQRGRCVRDQRAGRLAGRCAMQMAKRRRKRRWRR